MHARENRRYRQAAADYLHRPVNDLHVIQAADAAQKAADSAAYAVLRSWTARKEGRKREGGRHV